jgi:hypothetical protein
MKDASRFGAGWRQVCVPDQGLWGPLADTRKRWHAHRPLAPTHSLTTRKPGRELAMTSALEPYAAVEVAINSLCTAIGRVTFAICDQSRTPGILQESLDHDGKGKADFVSRRPAEVAVACPAKYRETTDSGPEGGAASHRPREPAAWCANASIHSAPAFFTTRSRSGPSARTSHSENAGAGTSGAGARADSANIQLQLHSFASPSASRGHQDH